ncbi:MAG: FAD-dependent oxidoreductase [Pyrinomonadaceae bacterium]|jgi:sulfide:quinone oxidoreductase
MQESHEVVIVGGGTAGISVAARLRRKGLGVAIIEPSDVHYYQPLWTLVGGGIVPKEDTRRPEADYIPNGSTWIKDRVTEFDPDANQVVTESGKRIGYDFLVVCPGIQIDWDKIKGLPESIGKDGVCSNYSYEYVDKTWEFIRKTKQGNAIFTQPNTPIKCGGAPQKICYLAEDYFRINGLRDKIEVKFITASPTIFGSPYYAPTLAKHCEDTGIITKFKMNLTEIRPNSKEAVFQNLDTGDEVIEHYDLLHVTPPMSSPDFIKRSPLANSAGWVDVDKETLRHTKFENIFGLGDASSLPTSKTGAAIRKQVPVVVENLLNQRSGKPLMAKYNGYTSCPLVTGYDSLIMAEFGYDLQPMETFPIDQNKERYSMFLVKRYLLPQLYWHGMLRGIA